MKLIMTLLVRDEEDIVAANIEFHLTQGVDFIIATDNLSADRTPEILKAYEASGHLHYIHETRDDYNQHAWVTSMARMAFGRFSADWVINNDADEFWWPLEGNLKSTFSRLPPEVNLVEAQRYNFVPVESACELFWSRMIYRERISLSSLGRLLPPKVAHRGLETVRVSQGNHSVAGFSSPQTATGIIEILHFPVRSYRQIENKIVKGGAAYERNRELPQSVGSTWRALYEEYRRHGHLRHYFSKTVYSSARLEEGLRSGELICDRRLAGYLESFQSKVETKPRIAPENPPF